MWLICQKIMLISMEKKNQNQNQPKQNKKKKPTQ